MLLLQNIHKKLKKLKNGKNLEKAIDFL